jgi:hypothetical protein
MHMLLQYTKNSGSTIQAILVYSKKVYTMDTNLVQHIFNSLPALVASIGNNRDMDW